MKRKFQMGKDYKIIISYMNFKKIILKNNTDN